MKILIAGDFCPQDRVAEKFEQGDYESVLGEVKNVITDADYSIVNFECPVTKGGEKPIDKCGPNHCCSEKGMEAVKWVGFNCVTLANNHFLDFGKEGVVNTLAACSKYEVDTVGGGMNLREAAKTLYKQIGGEKLAIINCCEHEFSIASDNTAGSNPLNPIQQYYAIQDARKVADYVLVIVHGGHEHYQLPSPRMVETYRFFVDAGADAVVNHHQHCFSGYEVYKDKPIFYGLGNFCFDKKNKRNDKWNEGFMIVISFAYKKITYNIVPYIQSSNIAKVSILSQNDYEKTISDLNRIITDIEILKKYTNNYYISNSLETRLLFEPLQNRIIVGAQRRGWLFLFHRKKHLLKLYNYIFCESRREMIECLKNK